MKKLFALTICLIWASTIFGQNTKPLVIQGKLINCPEKYLKIYFENNYGEPFLDTIHLDKNGNFYFKTSKITRPQRTSIQQNTTQINDFFVAPGYDLTITGDCRDYKTLFKTKKIQGVGSESNRYKLILDSVRIAKNDTTHWFELSDNDLLTYAKSNRTLSDSVAHVVFDKKPVRDPYFNYFKKMVQLDNMFMNLYFLVTHANIAYKNNYEKSVSFVRNNFDNKILDNISNDEYLMSRDYRTWLIGSEYSRYLINLDYQKDSTLRKHDNYNLEKVSKVYSGAVKNYIEYTVMLNFITFCKSFESLNNYKEQSKPYFLTLTDHQKKYIDTHFSEKEAELMNTAIGKPAPVFTLENNIGKTYSLADFKGKVVYLDLWASWCEPCRAETPRLKELYNKYKNDGRVAFVSVAVHDGKKEWQKALDQDKPDWIQLLDKDGVVSGSYVANMIPQFVIINKQGNIVNFNAPTPSSGKTLEDILIAEMAK